MKDIAKLNEDLRSRIVKAIDEFQKENGVELTRGIFYNYYSHINEKNEIHIALGIKETENGQG